MADLILGYLVGGLSVGGIVYLFMQERLCKIHHQWKMTAHKMCKEFDKILEDRGGTWC